MNKSMGACLLMCLPLVGCANNEPIPLMKYSLSENDTAMVGEVAGYTKDASVAKEAEVHLTLRNRDLMYYKAHKNSGIKMAFAMQQVGTASNGSPIMAYLPSEISFKETPKFEQILPTEPSKHPVWGTIDKALDKGLWAFLGYEFFKFGTAAIDGAGAKTAYAGDFNPTDSLNTSTLSVGASGQGSISPYSVQPEVIMVEPFIVE